MADFVQIPPDSTGKKIRHSQRQDIQAASVLVDLNQFETATTIVGLTSGVTGKYTGFGNNFSNTIVYAKDTSGNFTVGETLTINGVSALTVGAINIITTPNIHIADAGNPNNKQKVDNRGGAYVRFQEGDLQFSAIGSAQITQTSPVKSYQFTYKDDPTQFWNQIEVGGTIELNPTGSYLSLQTTGTSGSRATRTTNQYFPYEPGVGVESIYTVQYGNVGKANNVRSFGMFDLEDGVFFRLDENGMNVVLRSYAAGGTRVDTVVNQADWNTNNLLDSETDPFVLDVTKYNLYWIDYLWLGVGRVRFGVYAPNGNRIVCHVFENAGSNVLPYMKRGTLPIKFGNKNSDTTSGPSEIKVTCIAVLKQSATDDQPSGEIYTVQSNRVGISGSTYDPILSIKPALTYGDQTNRVLFIPTDIEVVVEGDPIAVDFQAFATLSGKSFTSSSNASAYLYDRSATSISVPGFSYDRNFYGSGVSKTEIAENLDFALGLYADGVTQPSLTFAAKCVNPAGTADVSVLVRWREVK